MTFVTIPRPPRSYLPFQIFTALFGGVFLFILGISVITGGYQLLFAGRVFPGISMAGLDLSNLTPVQATTALNQKINFPESGRIVLKDGERIWVKTPAELGLILDAQTSIQRAYSIGRQG